MSSVEPGLDQHEWSSRYASIEDDLHDDPGAALPELRRLVEEMLRARGYEEGSEPEVVAAFASAREVAEDDDADPGDVAAAIQGLTEIYAFLTAERQAP